MNFLNFASKEIDFLAIGDITTDAFIRLKDASVHCNINHSSCELCMKFADKIPFEFAEIVKAVGNAPNAAVSASRLGLKSSLVSIIGGDQNGRDCLETLKTNNVDTKFFITEHEKVTNYHYVLWYESERTILVNHQAYNYHLPQNLKTIKQGPKWIYLTSLGGGTENYHQEIIDFLRAHPESRLVFQPGTFQMKLGTKKLAEIYKRSDVFVCNVEESERILEIEPGTKHIKELLHGIKALGPDIVLISDGPKGAYMIENENCYYMPIYPDPQPPYERTGAGDAFASTFASALALGIPTLEALRWAPVNSMSVVQYIGAQKGLLTKEALLDWLAKGPAEYHPRVI